MNAFTFLEQRPFVVQDGLVAAEQPTLLALQTLSCRIAMVNELAIAMNRLLDVNDILQLVGQQVKWLIDFDSCHVALLQNDGAYQATTLFGPFMDAENLVTRALQTGQVQLCLNAQANNPRARFSSQLVIPLESEGKIFGALYFAAYAAALYTQEDLRIASSLAMQLAGAIHNARRFTELNQLYRQMEEMYVNLRRAEHIRDELVHMVVHDLRNPLTTISFSLNLIEHALKGTTAHATSTKYIQRAQSANQQMIDMIDDLLALGKLEAGELQPVLAPVNLGDLLKEKRETYQSQAENQAKIFSLDLPAQLPLLRLDAGLIRRVLDNLVSNAFKYTSKDGQIDIRVMLQDKALWLAVHDNGPGIAPEYHQRIFDKFVQVKKADGTPLHKGTGLGLTFCRLAIQAHGGEIWVESNCQQGSTFIFQIPDCVV